MELFEYWISLNITVILTVMKANTVYAIIFAYSYFRGFGQVL